MHKDSMENTLFEAAKAAYHVIDDKFGTGITVLDIHGISVLADYFIIATAGAASQLKAMADAVDQKLYTMGLRLKHMEGEPSSGWVLLDFGSIIVHLFDKEQRGFYNLERIWGDAKEIPADLLTK